MPPSLHVLKAPETLWHCSLSHTVARGIANDHWRKKWTLEEEAQSTLIIRPKEAPFFHFWILTYKLSDSENTASFSRLLRAVMAFPLCLPSPRPPSLSLPHLLLSSHSTHISFPLPLPADPLCGLATSGDSHSSPSKSVGGRVQWPLSLLKLLTQIWAPSLNSLLAPSNKVPPGMY